MGKGRKSVKRKLAMLVAAVMLAAQLPATAMAAASQTAPAGAEPSGLNQPPRLAANTYAGGSRTSTGTEYQFEMIKEGITIKTSDASNVEYAAGDGFKLKKNGAYEISGTWAGTLTDVAYNNQKTVITVASGVEANITLNNLSIDASNSDFNIDFACALAVEPNGKAAIALSGTNTLISGRYRAGLEVPELAVVSIDGGNADKLVARSGAEGVDGQGAGIGGGSSGGGDITINGGSVTAESGYGAGIGGSGSSGSGGSGGSGGDITINGGTVTTKSSYGAGIGGGSSDRGIGGSGGAITINGGTVTTESSYGAGIGGGIGGYAGVGGSVGGSGGAITINRGSVTATGRYGAGIGGGGGGADSGGGSGGAIAIYGGAVTATSRYGAGIGGGNGGSGYGEGGAFTINGDAIVFAKSNMATDIGGDSNGGNGTKEFIKGVVFEKNKGTVHGDPKLPGDTEIPAGYELTVPDGACLTIPDGITLKNEGTINIYGSITGNQPSGGTINSASATAVTFAVKENGGYGNPATTAKFGDTIQITATAQQRDARTLNSRKAELNQVDFYVGSTASEYNIGVADVTIEGGRAVARLEISLSGDSWDKGFAIGENTIIADFGGSSSPNLLDSVGTAKLVIEKPPLITEAEASVTAPAIGNTPDSSAAVPAGASYEVSEVKWEPSDASFEAGKAYTARVTLSPKPNYSFADTASISGRLNGNNAAVEAGSAAGTITLSCQFDELPLISEAEASVTAPAIGNVPDSSAAVPANANYEVSEVAWEPSDASFQAGKAYTARVTLSPKVNYAFADTASISGRLNGNNAVVEAGSAAGTITLSCQFDELTENILITEAEASVTAPAIGNAPDISAAVPANADYEVSEVAWEPSDASFQAGKAYTARVTLSPKVNYAFADTASISGRLNGNNAAVEAGSAAGTITLSYQFDELTDGGGGGGGGGRKSSSSTSAPLESYTAAGSRISQSVARTDLSLLASSGKSLSLSCNNASMRFSPEALRAILAAVPSTATKVIFRAAPADLSGYPDAMEAVGSRPAYDFTISYRDINGNNVAIRIDFPAGSASVSLAYELAEKEAEESLFMAYVDENGNVSTVDGFSYSSGRLEADVPHFSIYGVGYQAAEPEPTPDTAAEPVFSDIEGHWAKEDIEFAKARGLLSGTGGGLFSPDMDMTRGMFVTALYRLEGSPQAVGEGYAFTDIPANAYYAEAVRWAAQENIINGTSETAFSPDAPITREQMAVIMTNYANRKGYAIPEVNSAVSFADSGDISHWAVDGVSAMQRAGIINGRDGNRFDPQSKATRAEVSAVLRRFVEGIIDSSR